MTHRFRQSLIQLAIILALITGEGLGAGLGSAAPRKKRPLTDLKEILSRTDEAAKHLKTVSADLQYTKVTVLVNDRSTQYGKFYFHKTKNSEILLDFERPDPKVILFKKNKAEIFLPKTNQIQEYNLERHSELVQQFLLLGFGTDADNLRKAYEIKYLGEEQIGEDNTAVLELVPRRENVAAQLQKVRLWISQESWLPVQQRFFEPGGDYLETVYSAVKVNRSLPSSTFRIPNAKGAKRIKIN